MKTPTNVSPRHCSIPADGMKWPSAEQEALDERNDYEMLKAVQQSMLEWRTKSHHKHNR